MYTEVKNFKATYKIANSEKVFSVRHQVLIFGLPVIYMSGINLFGARLTVACNTPAS